MRIRGDHTTTFIFADQKKPLDALNEAIKAGGNPIGFMGYDCHNGLLTVQTRPTAEVCEDQETETFVQDYLNRLSKNFGKELKSRYPGATRDLRLPGEE
jgi:hypothetical protein